MQAIAGLARCWPVGLIHGYCLSILMNCNDERSSPSRYFSPGNKPLDSPYAWLYSSLRTFPLFWTMMNRIFSLLLIPALLLTQAAAPVAHCHGGSGNAADREHAATPHFHFGSSAGHSHCHDHDDETDTVCQLSCPDESDHDSDAIFSEWNPLSQDSIDVLLIDCFAIATTTVDLNDDCLPEEFELTREHSAFAFSGCTLYLQLCAIRC